MHAAAEGPRLSFYPFNFSVGAGEKRVPIFPIGENSPTKPGIGAGVNGEFDSLRQSAGHGANSRLARKSQENYTSEDKCQPRGF